MPQRVQYFGKKGNNIVQEFYISSVEATILKQKLSTLHLPSKCALLLLIKNDVPTPASFLFFVIFSTQ